MKNISKQFRRAGSKGDIAENKTLELATAPQYIGPSAPDHHFNPALRRGSTTLSIIA
jgi:hypothetical protein